MDFFSSVCFYHHNVNIRFDNQPQSNKKLYGYFPFSLPPITPPPNSLLYPSLPLLSHLPPPPNSSPPPPQEPPPGPTVNTLSGLGGPTAGEIKHLLSRCPRPARALECRPPVSPGDGRRSRPASPDNKQAARPASRPDHSTGLSSANEVKINRGAPANRPRAGGLIFAQI